MKRLIWIAGMVMIFGCKKDDHHLWINPPMQYKNLQDQQIGEGERVILDINEDGINDFRFAEWEYADQLHNTMIQEFFIFTYSDAYTLTDWDEYTQVLNKDQVIMQKPPYRFEWANVSQTIIVKQLKPTGGPNTWLGPWKNVQHKFLPVQITIGGKRHTGWIEMSMDVENKKLTLHKAAWSEKPNVPVRAGK